MLYIKKIIFFKFSRFYNQFALRAPHQAAIVASTTAASLPAPEGGGKSAINGAANNVPSSPPDAAPTMLELIKLNIAELVPEFRSALRPHFSSVHCDLSTCPSLNQAPFNLPVPGLGQLIYIVPETTISPEEAAKHIDGGTVLGTCNGFHIVTDGKSPHQVLRLMLSGPTAARAVGAGTADWRQLIRQLFDARLGENSWALVTACRGTIGLLKSDTAAASECSNAGGCEQQQQKNVMVWLAPVSRRVVPSPAGSIKKMVKKKVIKKVVRKNSKSASPEKSESPPIENGLAGHSPDKNPCQTTTTNGTSTTTSATNGGGAKSVSAVIVGRMASLFNNCAGGNGAAAGEENGNGTHGNENGTDSAEIQGHGVPTHANENGTPGSDNGTGNGNGTRSPSDGGSGDAAVHEISVARFGDNEHAATGGTTVPAEHAPGAVSGIFSTGVHFKKVESPKAAPSSAAELHWPAEVPDSATTTKRHKNGPTVDQSPSSVVDGGGVGPSCAVAARSKAARVEAVSATSVAAVADQHQFAAVPTEVDNKKERRRQSMDAARQCPEAAAEPVANGTTTRDTGDGGGTLRKTTAAAETSADDNARATTQTRRSFPPNRSGSTPSPPTGGGGGGDSESPCSFLSATSGSSDTTLIGRRFRREDAPSPSLSLSVGAGGGTALQQQMPPAAVGTTASVGTTATSARRTASASAATNGAGSAVGGTTNAAAIGGGAGSRLMNGVYQHQLLNVLSPISSCGSVVSEESERDFRSARDEITSTTITNAPGDEEEEDEEEDQTLMLLAHQRGGSAERSLTGGPAELLEMDEVSMRDDFSFSLMSTVSSQAPQRPTKAAVTTTGGGGGGTVTTNAAAGAGVGRFFNSSNTAATRLDEATPVGGGAGTRGFSSSSRWSSGRRRSSPSPSQKGSRTALDALMAASSSSAAGANSSPQFVSGMVSWRMPVTVLVQTLGLLSYKELSELRRVHPHWDELCGQLLNQGYFQLIGKAQRLLTDSQRKLFREPRLAQPIQLLTRLHVHVLNPVDTMRSFLDEGVLCFPYGALLDRALAMLGHIEHIVTDGGTDGQQQQQSIISYDEASDQLDQLQEVARRANVHYRQNVEPEAEKRMSEMYRLSAQQRLQRLDSFLVETSMSRVEREAEKSRNDMRWELDQLKEHNAQLKKENRELKHLCVRLDGRVDVLERKFKTMARLLQ